MRDNISVKKVWQIKTPLKRQLGRQKATWDKTIVAKLTARNVTWQKARELSRDRITWKKFVGGKRDVNYLKELNIDLDYRIFVFVYGIL